ncbi:hypothetical protein C8J57DRAFT_1721840 [Mycena rebaudengoi]|nr:hypothetical protein C8J57DRAFT_1721840 [Mycena rebaudengoi]
MRFTRTTRLAVLPLLLYGTIGGQATDYRLLYTIPAKDTMATFRVRFDETCPTWKPALENGYTFRGTLIEPGDYSGKHTDTEARLVCSWYNASTVNKPTIIFTREVAECLGAVKTSDFAIE